ncbi:hypothetical protein CTAYLR_001697 [Chrysophaeum taylorii]|uniref:MAM domain-containing protein n=1 Tax=Chrysophaeum taylorii TaxID=2483200 RepID=A0AAD7U6D6_9STRA|nr:hypothetical protein CTAYLR_001697 [Chrysophaeum taylorii]
MKEVVVILLPVVLAARAGGESRRRLDASVCFDLVLGDTYGDGWDGAVYEIANFEGTVVATGTMAATGLYSVTESICVAEACYSITVSSGSYPSEIWWSMSGLSGGAPDSRDFYAQRDGVVGGACTGAPTATPVPSGAPTRIRSVRGVSCDFEDANLCGWTGADWLRLAGATPSSRTGPSKSWGYYVYVEASLDYPFKGPFALTSPEFVSGKAALHFYYHMYGAGMGNLTVEYTVDGSSWVRQGWSRSGDQGDVWHPSGFLEIPIARAVRFVAFTGSYFTSDVAVDNVTLAEGAPTVSPTVSPAPSLTPTGLPSHVPTLPLSYESGGCNFEDDTLCGWHGDDTSSSYQWTRHVGPTFSSGTGPSTSWGYYVYVEATSPYSPHKGPFILRSPVFELSTDPYYLNFYYHMYGAGMGNLTVEYTVDGSSWVPQGWSRSGDQGDVWYPSSFLEIPIARAVRFVAFTGSTYQSDVAIDNVTFAAHAPTPAPTSSPPPTPAPSCLSVVTPARFRLSRGLFLPAGTYERDGSSCACRPRFACLDCPLFVQYDDSNASWVVVSSDTTCESTSSLPLAYLRGNDDARSPFDAVGTWLELNSTEYVATNATVEYYVEMSGATRQTLRMGSYVRTGDCDGRPSFVCVDCSSTHTEHLYYYAASQIWFVGSFGCGSNTVGLETYSNAQNPLLITTIWYEWDGDAWVTSDVVRVTSNDGATTLAPTSSFPTASPRPTSLPSTAAPSTTHAPSISFTPSLSPSLPATMLSFLAVSCTFEDSEECGWTSDGTFRWTRHAGGTSTAGTGPSYSWGHFMLVDTGWYHPHKGPFVLTSPQFTIDETLDVAYFLFYYHMYGAGMGNLTLEYSTPDDDRWLPQGWNRSGDQGDRWYPSGYLEIPSTARTVRFVVYTGSTFASDVAIDNVTFARFTPTSMPTVSPVPSPAPTSLRSFRAVSCDFDESADVCGWTTEGTYQWTRAAGTTPSEGTGPSRSWGYYMYVESSSPYYPHKGPFVLASPLFAVDEEFDVAYLQFYYHMYGDNMGNLTLEYLSSEGAISWRPQGWSKDGNQGDQWHPSGFLEIPSTARAVRFVAYTGLYYTSDVAVDNVTFVPRRSYYSVSIDNNLTYPVTQVRKKLTIRSPDEHAGTDLGKDMLRPRSERFVRGRVEQRGVHHL